MTLLITNEDVRRLGDSAEAVDCVAAGVVAAGGGVPSERAPLARLRVELPQGWLRVMAGALPELDVYGFKTLHLVSGDVRYLCSMYRLGSGEPLALIDANYLTVLRTSAAAAAAARHYWREDPIEVAVIGSGAQARDGLKALAAVCNLVKATVFSPSQENRVRFAREQADALRIEVKPMPTAAAAAAGADMVLCGTQSGGRIAFSEADYAGSPYVSSISSTLPVQRELDEALIQKADTVVLDVADALRESGDLLAVAGGVPADRRVLLSEYLETPVEGKRGLTVYKSIGSFEQDLALAELVWRRAVESGAAEEMVDLEQPKHLARPEILGI